VGPAAHNGCRDAEVAEDSCEGKALRCRSRGSAPTSAQLRPPSAPSWLSSWCMRMLIEIMVISYNVLCRSIDLRCCRSLQ
jgi:hypothetical protein